MIVWGAGTFRKAATDSPTCESTIDADWGGWMFKKNLLQPVKIWKIKYIGVDSGIRAKGYGAAVDVVWKRVKMKADLRFHPFGNRWRERNSIIPQTCIRRNGNKLRNHTSNSNSDSKSLIMMTSDEAVVQGG